MRFSLRTLTLFVLLIGSSGTLWWKWEPWALERTLKGHTDSINGIDLSRDGRRLVSASMDKTARVWDTQTGAEVAVLKGHSGPVYPAVFSPDGERVISGETSGMVCLWNANTGAQLVALQEHTGAIMCASFSPDGTKALSCDADNGAIIWDCTARKRLHALNSRVARPDPSMDTTACFSPDGTRVLTLGASCLQLWDAKTGEQLKFSEERLDQTLAASYSRDGRLLATVGVDGSLLIRDAQNAKVQRQIGAPERRHVSTQAYLPAAQVIFSPDARLLFSGTDSTDMYILEVGSERPLAAINADKECISGSRFSPDSQLLLTTSLWSGRALIWRTRTGEQLQSLNPEPAEALHQALFSPDGTRVYAAGVSPDIQVWHRRRPEYRWGAICLPEFWLTIILASALVWSILRDRREHARV
ncbi:MAG TPA: WD40 repeat domain-containing protein [Planctomycetota bacterium]|jgi:WD40 repeat protein